MMDNAGRRNIPQSGSEIRPFTSEGGILRSDVPLYCSHMVWTAGQYVIEQKGQRAWIKVTNSSIPLGLPYVGTCWINRVGQVVAPPAPAVALFADGGILLEAIEVPGPVPGAYVNDRWYLIDQRFERLIIEADPSVANILGVLVIIEKAAV